MFQQTRSHFVDEFLSRGIDAIHIHSAFQEHTRSAAPKKAKKLYFTDPFVARAVASALQMKIPSQDELVESVVITTARCSPAGDRDIRIADHQRVLVQGDRSANPEHHDTGP